MFDIKEIIADLFNIESCCNCNYNKQNEDDSLVIEAKISNLNYERKKYNKVKTHSALLDSDEKSIKNDLEQLMEFKKINNNRRIPVDI